ncbi:oligoendopeptidase F family protein [Mycoplasma zalophidermidis]|uniref:M3 family oligoendopeptidase n=1 Tax=Mycoplasma zalophidermidis TaxID=398174 RepID=UPI001C1252E9|nr:M3 family oligoendopeptidase [Mycoplasma zalophidermidis]MBU4690031.1 oligoendopeptidase F family protein [Mycoplasma zalophidermidis]
MKQYKNLKEVDKKYCFDLDSLLEGKTIEQLFEKYTELMEYFIETKDSKYDNIEAFIENLNNREEVGILTNKIHNYISNNSNRELTNSYFTELSNKWDLINHEIAQKMGSETVRFYKNIDKIKFWINDERLKAHKKSLVEIIEEYEHKLDDSVEEYIIKKEKSSPSFEGVFDLITDAEMDYGFPLDSKGKKHKLSPAARLQYLKSNDSVLRKNTAINWQNALYRHKDSLANLLFQQFNTIATEAKIRGYKNSVYMLTKEDKVDDELLQSLFKRVSGLKNVISKKNKWFKKFYEAKFNEKFRPKYDSFRELVNVKSYYTVEEMKQTVFEALKVFGKEYSSMIQKAYDENWIDFMTIDNKVSGAYSIGSTYGLDKKYILMNFDGDLGSVETLAHELGHSMHSYFSDKNNDINNSDYPIFLAEIASIFNELMLYDHLLKTSKNDLFKFKIIQSMIDGFVGTVHRQTLWANYEYNLYSAIEKGEVGPSYESIAKIYYENSLRYSTKKHKFDKKDQMGSVIVPHYYYGFYVYKYAIGQLVANFFYTKYKNDGEKFLQSYINNFLSAGGSDYPLNILANIGVDLKSEEFYQIGFKYFEELVEEYIKLGKKIFKISE